LYGGALMDHSSILGDGRARPSQGLLVAVGLIGVVVSVGAATGGFLTRFAEIGFIEYSWGDTLRYAAIFALVGGMLALCQHEVGVPIVIGACVAVVAVVGTVLAGLHLKVSRLTDEYPVRGVLFVGVGVVGLLGIVLGLASLRGRANAGFSVPVALLSVISLGMTAALLHLDKTRHAEQMRPFIGFVFIALLSVVCSFTGRYGVFAASVASASIVAMFIDSLDFGDFRQPAAAGDVTALALIVTLGAAAVAAVSRREQESREVANNWDAQFAKPTPVAATSSAWVRDAPKVPVTADVAAQRATGGTPVGSMPTSAFANTADQLLSGHPLIAPYEPTTAMPVQNSRSVEADAVETGAVSTVGQWAGDPYHRHQFRYWDGARWTEHVQNDGVAAIDPV